MNVFNRLLAIVFWLLVLAICIGVVGIASGLLTAHTVDRVHSYAPLHQALADFHTRRPQWAQVAKVAIGAAIGVIASLLLLLELTPARRERSFQLLEDQNGEVTIGYDTVRKVAEQAALDVAMVDSARCAVARRKESLQVRCRATIDRFANAEVVGGQIEEAIQRQVEQTVGRPVERVVVRVEPQKAGAPVRVR
ncbi:MAG: alkaline shock response membrane anchor protein AmaP [Chloroflexota bacterium]|nr:MAG: alkaline shock response membrane anchor protein AmaP [Chloroflexota bacterium]